MGSNNTGVLCSLCNDIYLEIENFHFDKITKHKQERWNKLQNNILALQNLILNINLDEDNKAYLEEFKTKVAPILKIFTSKPRKKHNRDAVCLNEIGRFVTEKLIKPMDKISKSA